MSKLSANIVKYAKQKSIPAQVVDVVGKTCSVILSGRGNTLHGLPFIGPSPTVGDLVYVNYTSGRPVVEAGAIAAAEVSTAAEAVRPAPVPGETSNNNTKYHNDMKGLQGGAPAGLSNSAEYVHLTQEELDKVNGPTRLPAADAGGTVNAITATFDPAITLEDRIVVSIVAMGANTTTNPSFTPNGLTTYLIVKRGGQPLEPEDIPGPDAVCLLEYSATHTRWELLNPALGNVIDGGDTPVGGIAPTFLFHFDGDDESTDFVDEAGGAWVANGNARIDASASKFGGSAYTAGNNNSYLSGPTLPALGTANFTWEAWFI